MKVKQNPNKEEYEAITQAVKENNGYCPCSLIQDEDTKCMCKEFREQTEEGYCHCGRFYKEADKKLYGYLAGSIFYYGDYLRNIEWAKKLREAFPQLELYSPIENTEINGTEGKKKFAGSKEIANGDNARLDKTDILIACIDGDVLPSGTCAEIGKFHEKIMRGDNKYIVGICTDNRQMYLTHSEAKDIGGASALGEQQYSYQNLYVTGLIKQVGVLVSNIDDAIMAIHQWLEEAQDNG